jgi:DNA-binding response OmpR family regulator
MAEKVLVVEDHDQVSALVCRSLENEGYATVRASDVDAAWQALVVHAPVAATIDLRLPGEGWTLIERIRGDSRYFHLPIVVLTGLLDEVVIERVERLGCEYMGKPFIASALPAKLRKAIARTESLSVPERADEHREAMISILMSDYRIEGTIQLAQELPDFSDAWESLLSTARANISIKDARVLSADGAQTINLVRRLEVKKADIRAAFAIE